MKPYLKDFGNKSPYPRLTVNLSRDGKVKKFLIHRLVLLAFVGPCPPGMEVLHGPGGHLDNRLSNLRYGSHSENILETVKAGTHVNNSGERNPQAKLNMEQIREIRRELAAKEKTQRKLAAEYQVSRATISIIARGNHWSSAA